MEDYWEEVSYDRIDFQPSEAYGWFRLPRGRAYYNNNEPWELPERAIHDCLHKADRHLDLPHYYGVNMWFSGKLANRGWGFRRPIRADGRNKTYAITAMSEPKTWSADANPPSGILAHEMGHGFGLQHTAGGPHQEFSSDWDLMSSISKNCSFQDNPNFHCIPVHPIAFQKMLLGWIHSDEIVNVHPGSTKRFFLKPIAQPELNGSYMAKVFLPRGTPGYLTVEARSAVGYDTDIPGEAVIIHRWHPTGTQETGDHPYLLGRTYRNGSVDQSGEMWVAGETYRHRSSGIQIQILSRTDDGRFEVRVVSP
jgi:M6 family metalloprotease-like protein